MPLPEPVRRELEIVDMALAGEAVDSEYAELAELALLLADARPELSPSSANALDHRLAALAPPLRVKRNQRPWFLRPAFGAGLAMVLVLAVLVVVLPPDSGPGTRSSANSSSSSSAGSSSGSSAGSGAHSASSGSAYGSQGLTKSPPNLAAATPQPNGRRIVQSSQLSLAAPPRRMATVSQELFNVVGSERGIVERSEVNMGPGGYGSFTLSIPTANLPITLARLGQLRYAQVVSSSQSTNDVNSRYLEDQRRLADAKALRSSLLTQLRAATTTGGIDSLTTRIHDTESTISEDEAILNRLQGRIADSAVAVTINPGAAGQADHLGGGFTLTHALQDALDVLRVVAGVALVALAVLVPLGLVAGLGAWLGFGWRRRRREQVLDGS